jgi:hypothetical protein
MTAESEAVVVQAEEGMGPLLHLAINKGVSVEALEKLVQLHERMADREAAKEFADAMAHFQSACPTIAKTSTARVVTKGGSAYTYNYAELDEIARTVRPFLHKQGLSYSWDSAVSEDGKRIRVVCTAAHMNGHKATASFEAPIASLSGAMSPQQEVAAALTFGKRQTLVQVLGLTTGDPDADGAAHNGPVEYVNPSQVEVLEALIGRCDVLRREVATRAEAASK